MKRGVVHGFHVVRGLFPLTWLSLILVGLMYYVWFWEVSAHANQILFSAVIVWLLILGFILGFTFISTVLVYFITRQTNLNVILGSKSEVGSYLSTDYRTFLPFFMPFVDVDIVLLESSLKRHEDRHFIWASERLEVKERGRLSALHRRITVGDIFGLTRITFVMRQKVELVLEPASSSYEMLAFQTKTSGDGYSHPEGDPRGELVEMRRYQAGDPLRLVLWKVFARSRKLVVRAPEPAIVEEKDMFVYFVSGDEDEPSASMARSFLQSLGYETKNEVRFAADGAKRLVCNEQEGIEDVIDSVSHRLRGAEDLMTVAPFVHSGAMAHCFLLVPPVLGPWLEKVRTFVSSYHVQPTFVISVDARKTEPQARPSSRFRRLFCDASRDYQDAQSARQALCQALCPLGTVRIVDVSTGAMREYSGGTR